MMISVLSFGFKYGIPEDAGSAFDARFCRIHMMWKNFVR